MKRCVLLLSFLILTGSYLNAQSRGLPMASYFKDQCFFSDSLFTPVFPISDKEVNAYRYLQDTAKRYSTLGYYLYQRELIEVHRPEGSLWITPILDIQGGVKRGDTSMRQFLNVRGVRLDALLGKKVFVTGSFYENQAFLPQYVRNYVNQRGEFYPNASDSSYNQVNAMIPNAARTKPFKTGGYDYAYASGMIRWDLTNWLSISGGNQPLFVGSGYRSLIFSDNTAPSMFGRMQVKLGKHIDYQLVRSQGMNMLRLPYAANGEALYERKGISINSVYFRLGQKFHLGIVETAVWARGDSIQKQPVSAGFYLPLPGGGTLQQAINNKSYALLALDMNYRLAQQIGLYAQLGTNAFKAETELIQVGMRVWPNRQPDFLLQLEYNHTGKQAYLASNPRIHFSSFNLPLGHIMGNGVDELVFRAQYSFQHFFVNFFTNLYLNQNRNGNQLLPIYTTTPYATQSVFNQQIQVGYRFNKTYAFEILATLQTRYTYHGSSDTTGYWANIGIRTNLNNHYFDF